MKLNLDEPININLSWDYSGNNRKTGTFNEQRDISTETHTIYFNLYVNLEIENDEGDYWNPPTFDLIDSVVEISEVKILDILDEEVFITEEELKELIDELENLVNYD